MRNTLQPGKPRNRHMLWLILLAALMLFVGFVRYLESVSLYYPDRTLVPPSVNVQSEDVFFETADGLTLHGRLYVRPDARANVLFFNGNAGNLSYRLEKVFLLQDLGFNVFLFDYRGYGQSGGRPSEKGLYRDAEAAFDALTSRADVGKLPLVLYGESLGGAVAIETALRRPVAALVTESTFSSIRDLARRYYGWVPIFLVRNQYDSVSKVRQIGCPKLFLHSREDELIPFAQGTRLFQAAAEPKNFLEINGSHNDGVFLSDAKVRAAMSQFFKEAGL